MGQRSNDAAVKDVQIKLSEEECARGMGQRESTNYAASKDARIMFRREEYAKDMEHIAIPMMNLQLLHHVLDQSLRRLLQHRITTSVIRPLKRIQQARIVYLKRWSSVELLQKIMRRSNGRKA